MLLNIDEIIIIIYAEHKITPHFDKFIHVTCLDFQTIAARVGIPIYIFYILLTYIII
jgi:hypothetical protein